MSHRTARIAPKNLSQPATVGLAVLLLTSWATAAAADHPTISRVEEDWELVVSNPDPNSQAPQVACVIAPMSNPGAIYSLFQLNHRTLPQYQHGGLQLQLYTNDDVFSYRNFPHDGLLQTPGEVVRWTQCMYLEDGQLHFEVKAGSSTAWGPFGGQGYLKSFVNTSLTDLNAYDPTVSTSNSGITYAANRVSSLTLKSVRLFTGEELFEEDTSPRQVYPASQN